MENETKFITDNNFFESQISTKYLGLKHFLNSNDKKSMLGMLVVIILFTILVFAGMVFILVMIDGRIWDTSLISTSVYQVSYTYSNGVVRTESNIGYDGMNIYLLFILLFSSFISVFWLTNTFRLVKNARNKDRVFNTVITHFYLLNKETDFNDVDKLKLKLEESLRY